MASWPTFDPNDLPKPGESLVNRNNVAVTTPYEPGSVFKVITVSAALETTAMTPDTIINCNHGSLRLPGRVVHEAHGGYGALSIADVLAKSSNIGAITFATRMGQERLNEYVHRFGFGKDTGCRSPRNRRAWCGRSRNGALLLTRPWPWGTRSALRPFSWRGCSSSPMAGCWCIPNWWSRNSARVRPPSMSRRTSRSAF